MPSALWGYFNIGDSIMEQMLILISKVCVVLVLILVSVVIEEYIGFNKEFKSFLGAGYLSEYDERPNYSKVSIKIMTQVIQGILFALFIYLDSTIAIEGISGEDIIYDAREVILNLSVIYGPITASITALASVMARIINNPYNSILPIVCIMCTYTMEMGYLYFLKKRGKKLQAGDFALMTFLTGAISNVGIYLMLGKTMETMANSVFTLMLVYPLFSISVYKIIEAIKKSNNLILELYKSDEKFKKMNAELQTRLDELKENEAHFKTMFYYSGEAIFLIKDSKIADINKAGIEMLGYSDSKEVIGREFSDFVMELKRSGDDKTEDIHEVFARVIEGETIKKEMRIETKKLSNLHIEVFMIDLITPSNEFIYMSARDISIRKIRENEILQKARYDELTNVANRKYFNEVTSKIIQIPESYPICYLMADINGLKLTNDVFGHAKGDELIVQISSVLSSCCRNSDIVARVGGDEFAILFTNTDASLAASLVERINKKLDREGYDSVKPSVAMGYAVKKSIDDKIEFESIVKSADAMMYINKSVSREKTRKVFLGNMLDKLYEISPDEIVRQKELRNMSEKFCELYHCEPAVEKKMNKLITYVNIGKLITPRSDWDMNGENISTLRFSRRLLENTSVILNIISHSENNIVTTEELFLLNENWDGSGEKYNTIGDEIPLEVRSFRMIYDIYYLKTHKEIVGLLTDDEIIALIRSESGKRYDPALCELRWEDVL